MSHKAEKEHPIVILPECSDLKLIVLQVCT